MHSNVSSLINDQINNELYSSYVYLDIANYYESKGLDGFANWFEIQAKEELDHALLLYKYLQNNGQKVTFEAIKVKKKRMLLISLLKWNYSVMIQEHFTCSTVN